MNRDVEQYLRRATRGLWGRKREEVREELGAHVEGRINAHLIAGLDERTAVERTLTELGQPAHVSAGMVRLHTAPTLMGLGAMMSAAALTVFVLVTGGMAQSLPGTLYWPSTECVNAFQEGRVGSSPTRDYLEQGFDSECQELSGELWMNFETIKPVLEAEGITATNLEGMMRLSFPNGEEVATVTTDDTQMMVYNPEDRSTTAEPGYFGLWSLLTTIAQNPRIPIGIEGWDNPTFTLGDASFQLGTSEQPFEGEDFYDYYLDKVLTELTSDVSGFYMDIVNPRVERLAVAQGLYEAQGMRTNWSEDLAKQVTLTPGGNSTSSVYGVIVNLGLENPLIHQMSDNSSPDSVYLVNVAQTEADGSIDLTVPANETLKFVDRFSANSEPGEAVLVELTADAGSWFKVVMPGQINIAN